MSNEQTEALKPCPFCGGDLISWVGNEAGDIEWPHCSGCGMQGPVGRDRSEAVARWNALPRATPSPAPSDTLEQREEAVTEAARRMVAAQGMDWAELDGADIGYWESLADAALSLPAREVSGNDVEASAWAWLDQTFGSESDDPVDRAYAADEMVDAFHAGRAALATTPAPREMEADLVELAKEMLENLKHCSLDSGCCHCGDSMDRHSDPMHCGHTPVDMGWTASANWIAKAETTLAKLDCSAEEG